MAMKEPDRAIDIEKRPIRLRRCQPPPSKRFQLRVEASLDIEHACPPFSPPSCYRDARLRWLSHDDDATKSLSGADRRLQYYLVDGSLHAFDTA